MLFLQWHWHLNGPSLCQQCLPMLSQESWLGSPDNFPCVRVRSWQGVSNIAGLEHWMERWNGKWVNICSYTPNLCNWHCSIWFELLTMSLGFYMYRTACISNSNVACRATSLSDNITVRKWGFPYGNDQNRGSSINPAITIYQQWHSITRVTQSWNLPLCVRVWLCWLAD